MSGIYETFEVVEVNERHGFARVRSERTGLVFHTALVPEGQPEPEKLRVGDRVRGLQRGQGVSRVTWISRAPPPVEAVDRARAVLVHLGRFGHQLPFTPERLADAEQRAVQASALSGALLGSYPRFFHEAEEADGSLLDRFQAAMAPYVKGFQVKPVAREAKVIVEPGAAVVELGSLSDPVAMFSSLLDHANALLEASRVPVRWVAVRRNWILAPPEVVLAMEAMGLVPPRTVQ